MGETVSPDFTAPLLIFEKQTKGLGIEIITKKQGGNY